MTAAEKIRIVLVEDNEVFRQTLELLLGLRDDVVIIGSVDNGVDAADVVRDLQPDVVVLDYRLPGMNGVEVTREIRRARADVGVVCLTASVSAQEVGELRAAGADACLTKEGELDDLIAAIHEAAR